MIKILLTVSVRTLNADQFRIDPAFFIVVNGAPVPRNSIKFVPVGTNRLNSVDTRFSSNVQQGIFTLSSFYDDGYLRLSMNIILFAFLILIFLVLLCLFFHSRTSWPYVCLVS